jgi:hypothetical protein
MSGVSLALGILLKYFPIVILPFLVLNKRRIHFRLFLSCAVIVMAGLLLSVAVWGTSTFRPMVFAANRRPIASIYEFVSVASPLRLLWSAPNIDWLEKPLWFIVGVGVFTWTMLRHLGPALLAIFAVLVTLLLYRVGYTNYQMVLFLLISYWSTSRWSEVREHSVLVVLLFAYFGFLGIVEIAIWRGFVGYAHYSMIVVLLKFVLGCALLVSLIRFATVATSGDDREYRGDGLITDDVQTFARLSRAGGPETG